jgi:hypothetical protein
VTAALAHLARWLVWQIRPHDEPPPERPANITIFSAPESR